MAYEELQAYLIEKFEKWAHEQRDLYKLNAEPLSDATKSRLRKYFDKRILDCARRVRLEEIPNPPCYADLEKSGTPIPLDRNRVAGFCLIDYILIRKGFSLHFSAELVTVFTRGSIWFNGTYWVREGSLNCTSML